MTPALEQFVIDSFAVGDLIVFAATQANRDEGLVNRHGVVRAVRYQHDCGGDLPRYDVEADFLNTIFIKVHPSHLIKDRIA
jgi:hypothetical protein